MEVHLGMHQTASCSWLSGLYNKHEPVAEDGKIKKVKLPKSTDET